MLSVIILAAGKSERMQQVKQLMSWGNTTILGQVIDNYLASNLGEVIVVLGYQADEIGTSLSGKPVKMLINQDYEQGMSSSVRLGLEAVDPESEGFIFALGDQPLVRSETIIRLTNEFHNSNKGIIIPVYRGKRGNPVIFARRYRDELSRVTGDSGGRTVIKAHPEDILEVTVDDKGVCIDIDTIDDYFGAIKNYPAG